MYLHHRIYSFYTRFLYIYTVNYVMCEKFKHILTRTHMYTHVRAGVCDVMVITAENGHEDPCSNPGRGCLHFISHQKPWEKNESNYLPSSYG